MWVVGSLFVVAVLLLGGTEAAKGRPRYSCHGVQEYQYWNASTLIQYGWHRLRLSSSTTMTDNIMDAEREVPLTWPLARRLAPPYCQLVAPVTEFDWNALVDVQQQQQQASPADTVGWVDVTKPHDETLSSSPSLLTARQGWQVSTYGEYVNGSYWLEGEPRSTVFVDNNTMVPHAAVWNGYGLAAVPPDQGQPGAYYVCCYQLRRQDLLGGNKLDALRGVFADRVLVEKEAPPVEFPSDSGGRESQKPSVAPSALPSTSPSTLPSVSPSANPTFVPSESPTDSMEPTTLRETVCFGTKDELQKAVFEFQNFTLRDSVTDIYGDIGAWCFSKNITDFTKLFFDDGNPSYYANFNEPIGDWDMSSAEILGGMFWASGFNQDINGWKVGKVKNMHRLFDGTPFDQPLNNWDVSRVEIMSGTFLGARQFNQPLDKWNTSSVTTLANTFYIAQSFNQALANWDTRRVSDLTNTFRVAEVFNQNIDSWDTSQVTSLESTFFLASAYNQPLASWDVANVWNTKNTFRSAKVFNQNIASWNVSSVENMEWMFESAEIFDQPLNEWDVSRVTNMGFTFCTTTKFNQPLDNWATASVERMTAMFRNSEAFNQSLQTWNVSSVNDMSSMFANSTFSQNLCAWGPSLQGRQVDVKNAFFESACKTETDPNLANDPPGPFCQLCTPDCFQNKTELQEAVEKFQDTSLQAEVIAKYGEIRDWCVTNITNFEKLFFDDGDPSYYADFNESLDGWDMSNAETTMGMFWTARSFNGDISSWEVSKVRTMDRMFDGTAFNRDISDWSVSSVESMSGIFWGAREFNQPLNKWDVGKVVSLSKAFYAAQKFDQVLGSWNVSSVTDMSYIFAELENFNQNLDSWDTSSVESFDRAFTNTRNYNQPMNSWVTSRATTMLEMFRGAVAFNQPLHNWKVGKIETALELFAGASDFNQDLCAWGSQLAATKSAGTLVDVRDIFFGTNCTDKSTPDLDTLPPGPFCAVCT